MTQSDHKQRCLPGRRLALFHGTRCDPRPLQGAKGARLFPEKLSRVAAQIQTKPPEPERIQGTPCSPYRSRSMSKTAGSCAHWAVWTSRLATAPRPLNHENTVPALRQPAGPDAALFRLGQRWRMARVLPPSCSARRVIALSYYRYPDMIRLNRVGVRVAPLNGTAATDEHVTFYKLAVVRFGK